MTLEPYQPLQLDIAPDHVHRIEDALLNLTIPETIHGVWSPSRNAPVDATKQVFVETLPPVLVLHLKRFVYDEVGGTLKSSKPVGYGTTLEIRPEMLSPARRSEPRPVYKLFGGTFLVPVLRSSAPRAEH